MRRTFLLILTAALLAFSPAVNACAADYEFTSSENTTYYDSTVYEDFYGSEYNYGGHNEVDYLLPKLGYGRSGSTQIGAMERAILTGLQNDVLGSEIYGITADSPSPAFVPGIQSVGSPDLTVVYQSPKYTSVAGMEYSDGSIGVVSVPSLNISMKVWEGETNASMAKGLGHYSSTSGWDGNVGVCGHNRGSKYVIGAVKDLKAGDVITYTTVYGSRTYKVTFVGTIANNDWSNLQATADNRITITTCLADHPESRVCVQGVEIV